MSDFLTKKEFEAWQKNQKSPSQLLSYLLLAQGGNFKVPLIIFGTFNAGSAAIKFTRAFKTAPTVVAITASTFCFCTITNLSSTGVTIRSMSAETLAQTSNNVYWVAIGESS